MITDPNRDTVDEINVQCVWTVAVGVTVRSPRQQLRVTVRLQLDMGLLPTALQIEGGEWQYKECVYCSEQSHGNCAPAAAAAACL